MGKLILLEEIFNSLRSTPEHQFFLYGETDLLEDAESGQSYDVIFYLKDSLIAEPEPHFANLIIPVVSPSYSIGDVHNLACEWFSQHPDLPYVCVNRPRPVFYRLEPLEPLHLVEEGTRIVNDLKLYNLLSPEGPEPSIEERVFELSIRE